jgi:beta-glucuronidase
MLGNIDTVGLKKYSLYERRECMLYPKATDSRVLMDLSGVWKFMIDDETKEVDVNQPLPTKEVMAVPASFNDQTVSLDIRQHSGYFWY